MEENLNLGESAPEQSQEVLECKRELRLIGDEIDRLFLSRTSSPLLPEWNLSEREAIIDSAVERGTEEKPESDFGREQQDPETSEGTVPAESDPQANRDESDLESERLARLIQKIAEMREAWSLI